MPFGIGPVEILILLVGFGVVVWALVVCAMKAQWLWFVLGLFFFLFAVIGALLPAKPGSAWARRKGGVAA